MPIAKSHSAEKSKRGDYPLLKGDLKNFKKSLTKPTKGVSVPEKYTRRPTHRSRTVLQMHKNWLKQGFEPATAGSPKRIKVCTLSGTNRVSSVV